MVEVVVKGDMQEYFFSNGFSVRADAVDGNNISLALKNNNLNGTIVYREQKRCNVANKAECKKAANDFFATQARKSNVDMKTVAFDHEERFLTLSAFDTVRRMAVGEDVWFYIVPTTNGGIKISCPWGESHFNVPISSSQKVKDCAIAMYKEKARI